MFIALPDLNVHVQISGQDCAPPLLLLHSLGASLEVWDEPAAALARDFRVIRADMRGHGLTQVTKGPYTIAGLAEDALAVLDALGIASAHVAGLSIGGLIAQEIAARAPERVQSLVLCDTAMVLPPADLWHDRAATVRRHGMAALVDSVMARWVTPPFRDAPAGHGLRMMLLRTDPEGYAGAAEAIAAADLSHGTGKIIAPTLILVGALDEATPIPAATALHDAIACSRLVVLANAAHIPTVETPEQVTAELRHFLMPADADPYQAGLAVRRAVLGPAHVERATAAITDLDRDFQHYITETAWGGVWTRPHFDRRQRSIVTLAILAALNHHEEFKLHIRATRNTGASPADITELLMHVAVYGGVPAANSAMRLAKESFRDMETR